MIICQMILQQMEVKKKYVMNTVELKIEQERKQKSIRTVLRANEQMINSQSTIIKGMANKLYSEKAKAEQLRNKLSLYENMISSSNETVKSAIQHYVKLQNKLSFLQNTLLSTTLGDINNCNEYELVKRQLNAYNKKKNRKLSHQQQGITRMISKTLIFKLIEEGFHRISVVMMTQEEIEEIDDKIWAKQTQNYQKYQLENNLKFVQRLKSMIKKKFIPHKYRHKAWPILIQNRLFIRKQYYNDLVDQLFLVPEKVKKSITRDLDRSFSEDMVVDKKNFREDIFQILQMFHLYRPDISYVQGMIYPLIILLLNLDKYEAFKCFCNVIVANPFVHDMFRFKLTRITLYCRGFDKILLTHDKKISQHLTGLAIPSQNYLIEWFYTFFRKFSIKILHKVWDLFLLYSYPVFYKLSIAILMEIKSLFLDTDYSNTMNVIKNYNKYADEDSILSKLTNMRLGNSEIIETISKVSLNR